MRGPVLEYESKTIWKNGVAEGEEKGINAMSNLIQILIEQQKFDEVKKVVTDHKLREQLLQQYQLA